MASSSLLVVVVALLAFLSPAVLATGGASREKRTHIRVYVHEQFSGPNATVGSVAPSPLGANSTFGEVGVLDDALRAGPGPASGLVGRYQGVFVGSDLADASYHSAITLVFAAGEHRGGTLSLQGRYSFPADDGAVLERAVVGGTGGFRMARGYSLLKVVSTPPEAAVFQLDLFVFTPRGRY
ncbi:pterocarpan synthase 1-like [Phragmites australis]|uniref:pterocarpan synthase 1-like n=1 Tax=Phragmites australis TaxID=29695 RepID=UPI002D79B849|nr:pterocarpan synthase 1-like [Phragmites australis]